MANPSHTVVTSKNIFQRLGGSIKGIFGGFIMFLLAFPLLFWGEKRAIDEYKNLQQGRGAVVEAPADKIDPALDGKLVHVTGDAVVHDVLEDPLFGISVAALGLERKVEMYQWVEDSKQETVKKLGGTEETTTTYSYDKKWQPRLVNSGAFHDPLFHRNPSEMPYENLSLRSSNTTMGPYKLPEAVIRGVGTYEPLLITAEMLAEAPEELPQGPTVEEQPEEPTAEEPTEEQPEEPTAEEQPEKQSARLKLDQGRIYLGKDPASPNIGDVRFSFTVVKPGPISVIAGQTGETFRAFTSDKVKKGLLLTANGHQSADEMFTSAEKANKILAWVIRFGGWLMMFLGLSAVVRPLSVAADVVPFLGRIVGGVSSFVIFLIATLLAVLTIAVCWVLVRPLLGVALLVVVIGLAVAILKFRGSRKTAPEQTPAAA